MRRRNILSVAISLLSVFAFGQLPPQVSDQVNKLMPKPVPQSPNVASLGKYGDYQVNLYTGLPEISIPIYETKSGELTVPITLSYHASGIRYTDQASWVGLGWSLSGGGQISRKMNGKNDEEFYYNNLMQQSVSPCDDFFYIQQVANDVSDRQPDIFSYSYPGKSGKFIIEPALSGQPHNKYLIPYEPIKITELDGLTKYEIIDEAGVLYRFGKNSAGVTASETSGSSSGGNTIITTNAWYLMDVIAPNSDDKILISYQNVGSFTTTDVTHNLTILDEWQYVGNPTPVEMGPKTIVESISAVSSTQLGLSQILFEEVKLNSY